MLRYLLVRSNPLAIVLAFALLVFINVTGNIFFFSGNTLQIYNAVFEMIAAVAGAMGIMFYYREAKKNNFGFSRTLRFLFLGMATWALGEVVYLLITMSGRNPFISPTDLFFISATIILAVSALTIPGRQQASNRRNLVFVEISILVLSAIVLFTVLLLLRGTPHLSFDLLTLLMVFVYPVLDVILLWIIMIVFFTYPVKESQQVLGFIFAGVLCLFTSDLFYLMASIYGPFNYYYIIDIGYFAFYTFILLAARKGYISIRQNKDDDRQVNAFKMGNWIVYLPGVFLVVIIGLLMTYVLNQSFVRSTGIVVIIMFIIVLFILHQYMVIAENIKLTREMRQINVQLESKVEQRTAELKQANSELQAEMKEREKVEQNLALSNQDLALLNKDKDKLFSVLAHDLRSPLGSIMSLSSLLAENIRDFDESELIEIVGTLNKSATLTFQLLNDLLAWSAIQMGRGEREKEIFDLGDVVTESIAVLRADADRKQIVIETEIDKLQQVFADRFAVQTVIRNLLSNAIKFTHTHGNISLAAEPKTGFVILSIADNGIGIARDKQKKIFRVDKVSSSPGTNGEKGTGFGLLLCKDLVERNGGKIWFESEKDQGSKFYFSLPVEADTSTHTDGVPAPKVNYEVDITRKIAITTLIGEINTAVLYSDLNLIWKSSGYKPEYSVLIDLRQAVFDLESNDIPLVLDLFSAMPGQKKNRKFAMLTTTPQQVAISTMFIQKIKNNFPFIVEIFSTYEAAMNWLGV